MNRLLQTDPLIYITLLVGLAVVQAAGYVFGQPMLMPLLSALLLWPFLLWALRHTRIDIAWRLLAVWMLFLLLAAFIAGRQLGPAAQNTAPASIDYIASHMRWLAGSDARPPAGMLNTADTLRRFANLILGSLLTAGLLPLFTGARSLAVLGLWMADMSLAPRSLALGFSLAPWVWSELIASWLLLPLLVEPLITGTWQALWQGQRRRMLALGTTLLTLTLILQWLMPPLWQRLVHPLVSL